jgi:uncharacterized protein YjbI with pentapeptide repeats
VANEEHVKRLKQGVAEWNAWRVKPGSPEPDLAGANLRNADLRGADLTGANLTGADLTGADLTDADLLRTNLIDAFLGGANLIDAFLGGADLSGADLSGADLSGADLIDAKLIDAYLGHANLTGADLTGVSLINANLTDADLSQAFLRSAADLSRAQLTNANLTDVKLKGANLTGADLTNANLTDANLSGVNLTGVRLTNAWLMGAKLSANLTDANLTDAKLTGVSLTDANLTDANLTGADLTGADLTGASLLRTVFGRVDLTGVIGLERCTHWGPSIIDHQILQKSGRLPLPFLRGVGLPDRLIEYLPSLLEQAIQYYSCFISYSTKDQEFADRLHADLQNKGVRCWFAPHDMPIGGKILDTIDEAIRLRDKVLLILSEHSIQSDWVEDEVSKAFEEERKRGQIVLFPLRIDDAVMDTGEAWAAKLRAQRHIGDFQRWKDHDGYKTSFERVLRDLKRGVEPQK